MPATRPFCLCAVSPIPCILAPMRTTVIDIADRVRGAAAEKRFTQQRIADTLGITRGSVAERLNGRVAFTAAELWQLARAFGVDVRRFYPEQGGEPSRSAERLAAAH